MNVRRIKPFFSVFGPFYGGYSPLPSSLGFWLIRGSALGPIGGLSTRQFNSCLSRIEDEDEHVTQKICQSLNY